jgi:hypothetical protein
MQKTLLRLFLDPEEGDDTPWSQLWRLPVELISKLFTISAICRDTLSPHTIIHCTLLLWLATSFILKMEVASTYETTVNINQTAWCHIPEDGNLHINLQVTFTGISDHVINTPQQLEHSTRQRLLPATLNTGHMETSPICGGVVGALSSPPPPKDRCCAALQPDLATATNNTTNRSAGQLNSKMCKWECNLFREGSYETSERAAAS